MPHKPQCRLTLLDILSPEKKDKDFRNKKQKKVNGKKTK